MHFELETNLPIFSHATICYMVYMCILLLWLQMDTGFIVWSFQGRQLYKNPMVIDKFCQLLWRPRPPTLLTDEHLKVMFACMLHLYLKCIGDYTEHQKEYQKISSPI